MTINLKTPMAGGTKERYVVLYLPSNIIDGDLTVYVNGTQFYPSPSDGDIEQCLSLLSNDYCTKIRTNVDKIEGWSIVRIKDDTTEARSAVIIEIFGTTAIPEFPSSQLIIVMTVAISIAGSLLLGRPKDGK